MSRSSGEKAAPALKERASVTEFHDHECLQIKRCSGLVREGMLLHSLGEDVVDCHDVGMDARHPDHHLP